MYDKLRYKGDIYQTKDTPHQLLMDYYLRDDGTLWVEEFDQKFEEDSDSFLGFTEERTNYRWIFCEDVSGDISFYRSDTANFGNWIEYRAEFKEGNLINLERVKK